jgi:hypothetical protein
MIKRLGFCEKVKRQHYLGRKAKAIEPHRGCMQGLRAPSGQVETAFRFAFRYGKTGTSYRVFVIFRGEAWRKWGAALRKTLESWEFGDLD